MKTESELDQDILLITMKIQEEFPELSKYLSETPLNFSYNNNAKNNKEIFKEYYDSLNELLRRYSEKTLNR